MQMDSRSMSTMTLSCITIFMLVIGLASSDLAKDREECVNQLIGLTTCLPYVGGDSKSPTPDCCTGLKEVVAKSKKCLCILVRDRDDPDLGFKINGTLALGLPDICHAPNANISSCLDLLHLAPHSPEAKIFEQFANSTKSSGSSPVRSDKGSSGGNGTSSSGSLKNDGGQSGKIRWLGVEMICGVLLWCFTSHLIYNNMFN